jgi:hypothetical protein
MRIDQVYLLHPRPKYLPLIGDWIGEVEQILRADAAWYNWGIHPTQYDDRNSFDVQLLFVRVLNRRGPVLLLQPVQLKALGDLQQKLRTHAIVLVKSPADSLELWEAIEEARSRHENGEPLLPRKMVVAILIVRKLRNRHYWGGNAKGYLWHFELARGRGVDERFQDVVEDANTLLLNEILIKKTSKGQIKYALNQRRDAEVHAIADSGTFQNKHLEKVLLRDTRQESAEYLQQPSDVRSFTITRDGSPSRECASAVDAIAHIRTFPDAVGCEVSVTFQNDRVLRESFEEKRVLLQYIEAFRQAPSRS